MWRFRYIIPIPSGRAYLINRPTIWDFWDFLYKQGLCFSVYGSRKIGEKVAENFSCQIPADTWDSMKPVKVSEQACRPYVYRMKKWAWTHAFSAVFAKHNNQCVLSCQDHRVNPPPSRGAFVIAYAHCVRRPCSMKYTFTIQTQPKQGCECGVIVTSNDSKFCFNSNYQRKFWFCRGLG